MSSRSFNIVCALDSPVFDFHVAYFNCFHLPACSD